MGFRPNCDDPLEVALDRFAYLKLHGTIGVFATKDLASKPEPAMPFGQALDDQLVCDSNGDPKHPLVVFPHEKSMLGKYPGNQTSFRKYIPKIWTEAHKIMRGARSVEFAGYSFPDADVHGENYSVKSLLKAATSCRQIVVCNIDPERVANRIRDAFPDGDWRIELRKGRLEDR